MFMVALLDKPFPKRALVFTCLLKKLFENTVGKGDTARSNSIKLLITSNFFFSNSVFYWFGEFSAIFIKFEIVIIANSLGLEESKICSLGKSEDNFFFPQCRTQELISNLVTRTFLSFKKAAWVTTPLCPFNLYSPHSFTMSQTITSVSCKVATTIKSEMFTFTIIQNKLELSLNVT